MIFKEDVPGLMGQPVKFLTFGRRVNKGVLEGFSGAGCIMIKVPGGRIFSSLKDVFKIEDEIPDEGGMREYVIEKYEERMADFEGFLSFPLEHDLKHDMEAREAYKRKKAEFLSKAVPMMVEQTTLGGRGVCPACGKLMAMGVRSFCDNCGQALKKGE